MMKTCTKCYKEYPATTEYFCKNSRNIDGLHNWCKNCQKEYDLNRSKNKDKVLQEQELALKQIKIKHPLNLRGCFFSSDYISN